MICTNCVYFNKEIKMVKFNEKIKVPYCFAEKYNKKTDKVECGNTINILI